tara:strand:- start:184 stop:402 length:219 start_codon:yes stop_codon:yes gene_type:complete
MESGIKYYGVRDIAISLCNGQLDETRIYSLGKDKIRPRLRKIYPEQAPGKGGKWNLTYEQVLNEVIYWRDKI